MLWRTRSPLRNKLAFAVRRFRAVRGHRFVLWHDPDIDSLDVALVFQTLSREIAMLEQRFGRRLRRWRLFPARLPVYLFRSTESLAGVYGAPVGGFANWYGWLVAIDFECDFGVMVPHELAHIFAGWWNPGAPAVLSEGLAVWIQRTWYGSPIDTHIRRRYTSAKKAVAALLGPVPVIGTDDWRWYYALAGSFTGFLIRRAGWDHYRAFYQDRSVTSETFSERFEKYYGLKLEVAGRVWFGQLPGVFVA